MYELATADVNSEQFVESPGQIDTKSDPSTQGSKTSALQHLLEALIILKHCMLELYGQPTKANSRLFKMSC